MHAKKEIVKLNKLNKNKTSIFKVFLYKFSSDNNFFGQVALCLPLIFFRKKKIIFNLLEEQWK